MRGDRVEARRKVLGISREKLAEQLGVESNTLFRWEKNHREPSDDIKWKISEILEVDIAWLMGAGADEFPREVSAPPSVVVASPFRIWVEIDPVRIDRKKISDAISILKN